jgi:AraC family transcriptional regulator
VGGTRFERLTEGRFAPSSGLGHADGTVRALAIRLGREVPPRDEASSLIVEGLALELLGQAAAAESGRSGRKPPRWLVSIRDRLMEDPAGAPSIDSLAQEAGLHPGHVVAQFRAWFGGSPGELVRQRRVDLAVDLILRTELSLTEIAHRAGYYDQSHFTNDVRKRTGLTPGSFRRSARNR